MLAECGGDLINDPGFHRLIEDVHSQMNADPELAISIASATAQMLEPVTTPVPR